MFKKLLFLSCVLFVSKLSSQTFTYGLNGGISANDLETSDDLSFSAREDLDLGLHFGAFIDLQFGEGYGIKTDFIYNSTRDYYSGNGPDFSVFHLKVKSIQISPKLKYHFNKNYNIGAYLLLGPRLSIVTGTSDADRQSIDGFYKSTNLGFQAAFGICLTNWVSVELIGDYTITAPLEFDYDSQRFLIGFINLNVNVEKLLNN